MFNNKVSHYLDIGMFGSDFWFEYNMKWKI
jgi:hypothetical protein